MRKGTKWNKLKVEPWKDGIVVEYREYDKAYSVGAKKDNLWIRIERSGLRKGHDVHDCFERTFQFLERENPFSSVDRPEISAGAVTLDPDALEDYYSLNAK